jgi:hypothetical protein
MVWIFVVAIPLGVRWYMQKQHPGLSYVERENLKLNDEYLEKRLYEMGHPQPVQLNAQDVERLNQSPPLLDPNGNTRYLGQDADGHAVYSPLDSHGNNCYVGLDSEGHAMDAQGNSFDADGHIVKDAQGNRYDVKGWIWMDAQGNNFDAYGHLTVDRYRNSYDTNGRCIEYVDGLGRDENGHVIRKLPTVPGDRKG